MILGFLIFAFAFGGYVASMANTGQAAMLPGGTVSPVNPATGFPFWYQDQNGLALDLMEASDGFGISDPVDPANPFSQQIGFNAEGFWWSAEASAIANGIDALVINALEAAFAGEAAVNGEQSAFGRVRFKIDVPVPGTYTVRHPFGTETFVVGAVGPGPEIQNAGMNGGAPDIGCFATLNPPVSCDPNSPNGNLDPNFNFSAALQSGVGPFLTWDTFNSDPALSDPLLINPANPTRRYVGNPLIEHAIKGSPVGQNFFEVAGPGGITAGTSLFTITGRLANLTQVFTSLSVNPANATVPVGGTQQFTALALDQFGFPMSPQPAIVWNTTDNAIGTVNASGLFTAVSVGAVSVSAAAGTITGSAAITVSQPGQTPVLTSIAVTPSLLTIPAGETRQFLAAAFDQFGNTMNVPIVWTSSAVAAGTINSATGFFSAMGAGITNISATSGAISGTAAITVTSTALQAVGPIDMASGFPLWYQDASGLKLGLCLARANGFADPNCVLPAAGQESNFNPNAAISFPNNFPSESFYYIADSNTLNVGPDRKGKAVFRMALEAAFASGAPQAGQQITFLRINMKKTGGLRPNSTYTATHPFGTFNFSTDRNGNTIIGGSGQAYRAEDGSFTPGAPNVFSFLLPATNTNINKFLAAINPAAPAGYIGRPGATQTIANGINGGFFRITGPDIGGRGINSIQTNLWRVAGRIDTTPAMSRLYSIDPADKSVNVPINKTIVATFNENIEPGTTYSGITLRSNNGKTVEITKTIVNNILLIDPSKNLEAGKTYKIFLPTDAIEYASGTYLPQDYNFSFTTLSKNSKKTCMKEADNERKGGEMHAKNILAASEKDAKEKYKEALNTAKSIKNSKDRAVAIKSAGEEQKDSLKSAKLIYKKASDEAKEQFKMNSKSCKAE